MIAKDSQPAKRRGVPKLLIALGLVAGVVGGAYALWETVLEYRFVAKRFGVVEDGVYRSGQLSVQMVEKTLANHDIEVVVSLRPDQPGNPEHEAEQKAVKDLGIEWKVFPLLGDGTGDIARYADAIEAIDDAKKEGKPVLVHCHAGAYRTGGVVAAYRVLVKGESPQVAWAEMRRYKWDDDDVELPNYLNEHMEELATLLVERGVIDKVPDPLPVLAP